MPTATIASLLTALVLWTGAYACYLGFNRGLAPNARLQQFTRYLVASLVAFVPTGVTLATPFQPALLAALAVAVLWMVTFPLCYHLTHRRSSPDYDHQIDGSFAIYLYALLSALMLLSPLTSLVGGLVMAACALVCIAQWVYFAAYGTAIDASGMKTIKETNYNEVIEYLHSYRPLLVAGIAVMAAAAVGMAVATPLLWPARGLNGAWWTPAVLAAVIVLVLFYMLKPRRGLLMRTGLMLLYSDVSDYVRANSQYMALQKERLATLKAVCPTPLDSPHTIVMVIGESASRDFMSAFSTVDVDTTPWLSRLAATDANCHLFPNAYSCDIQTVPTLERALTEANQYAGGTFAASVSMVDIAHKLGYHVSWFSNQGHLGAADTPVTIVAEMSDRAEWTLQVINKPQYDEQLLDLLKTVPSDRNNLVVLHFKGSHFNYENRFPPQWRTWGSEGNHDKILNYKNTIRYSDHVLESLFNYAKDHLNMHTFVYMSDHADVPDRHRQPNFGGYRDLRIPLVVWHSVHYAEKRPHRAAALRQNRARYWTNDLLYELMNGLMDADSNHFDEGFSLASVHYSMERSDLTAVSGTIRIDGDNA